MQAELFMAVSVIDMPFVIINEQLSIAEHTDSIQNPG
jgi:hypothetical protein